MDRRSGDARQRTRRAPEELGADPVTRRTVSLAEGAALAESAAEADARAVAANAAKRLQTVGRTARRTSACARVAGGDVRGGARSRRGGGGGGAAAARARDATTPGPATTGPTSARTRVYLPRRRVCWEAYTRPRAPRSPRPGSRRRRPRNREIRGRSGTLAPSGTSTASAARTPRALALDLLVEMDPAEFKQPSARATLLVSWRRSWARADRFRVTAYDEVSGAATVSVDDAPGRRRAGRPRDVLAYKIDADALLIDPAFGSVVLAQIIWPEGWRDGVPPPPSLVTNDVRGETSRGASRAAPAGSGDDVSSAQSARTSRSSGVAAMPLRTRLASRARVRACASRTRCSPPRATASSPCTSSGAVRQPAGAGARLRRARRAGRARRVSRGCAPSAWSRTTSAGAVGTRRRACA